jgi:hypothetical protein
MAKKDTRWIRTTDQLEEILKDSKGVAGDGNWDALYDSVYGELPVDLRPVNWHLTEYIGGDHEYILVFSNGYVHWLHQWHMDHDIPEGETFDGDLWDVTSLGWA